MTEEGLDAQTRSTSGSITDAEVLKCFAGHAVDFDNVEHYRNLLMGRLAIYRCQDCGRWHHPSLSICDRCWSNRLVATEVSGAGRVFLATTLYMGPPAPGVDYVAGYRIITAELDEQEGLRITGPFIGESQLPNIGTEVRAFVTDRAGQPLVAFAREADSSFLGMSRAARPADSGRTRIGIPADLIGARELADGRHGGVVDSENP